MVVDEGWKDTAERSSGLWRGAGGWRISLTNATTQVIEYGAGPLAQTATRALPTVRQRDIGGRCPLPSRADEKTQKYVILRMDEWVGSMPSCRRAEPPNQDVRREALIFGRVDLRRGVGQ